MWVTRAERELSTYPQDFAPKNFMNYTQPRAFYNSMIDADARNYSNENNYSTHFALPPPYPTGLSTRFHILLNAINAQQKHYVRPAKGRMFRGFKSLPATVTPAGSTLE